MEDTPGQTLPGLGVGVRHLLVLCQLSLVPFNHSCWCLSLRASSSCPSCGLALLAAGTGTVLFCSPQAEGWWFPPCLVFSPDQLEPAQGSGD